jgi:Cdc6-like AAA superfamily ATPase
MKRKNIAEVLAEEAEHAEQHRDDELAPGYRRARPPREPAQVYSLRIPVDRLEQLRRLAADKHMTPSALMRSWVLERLDAEASAEASVLVVAGDPGAGKTAVLQALLREVVREELERAGVKRAS